MITFWIAAVLATVVALGLIVGLALRPVPAAADPARAVYRRQLGEIDDMARRGVLGEEERKSAYAEAARRLLGEGEAAAETFAPRGARFFIVGSGLLTGAFAVGVYLLIGHPNMPDQPYAKRLVGWQAQFTRNPQSLQTPQLLALMQGREKQYASNPQFLAALADLQMRVGDTIAAERSLERSVSLDPKVAESWDHLGEAQYDLAQDTVTPQARRSLDNALALDPRAVMPRYLLANDDIDAGRISQGLSSLRALLPDLDPDARAEVQGRIASVEKGESAVPGASASPQILAMVQGLADRLKTDPNNPEDWARLVRAYAVLGDKKALDGALAEARRYFKDRPADLAAIEAGVDTAAPPPPGASQD